MYNQYTEMSVFFYTLTNSSKRNLKTIPLTIASKTISSKNKYNEKNERARIEWSWGEEESKGSQTVQTFCYKMKDWGWKFSMMTIANTKLLRVNPKNYHQKEKNHFFPFLILYFYDTVNIN